MWNVTKTKDNMFYQLQNEQKELYQKNNEIQYYRQDFQATAVANILNLPIAPDNLETAVHHMFIQMDNLLNETAGKKPTEAQQKTYSILYQLLNDLEIKHRYQATLDHSTPIGQTAPIPITKEKPKQRRLRTNRQ